MSEQERPTGPPQTPQDYSLPSFGEQTDDEGRPTNSSGPRRRAKRAFDPTQYVQGKPPNAAADSNRHSRYQTRDLPPAEDLPPPSYRPQDPALRSEISQEAGFQDATEETPVDDMADRVVVRNVSASHEVAGAHGYQPEYDAHSPLEPVLKSVPLSDDQVAASRNMAKAVNVVGAFTSIALVLGLGFWGYRLAVRDVSGVPIVAALDGPSRIQPEDPGGELATHMGLTVNAVQAAGEAEATADRLVLAPKPVEIREGDGVISKPIVAAPKIPPTPAEEASEKPKLPDTTATEVSISETRGAAVSVMVATSIAATRESTASASANVIVAPKPLDVDAAAIQLALSEAASIPNTEDLTKDASEPAVDVISATIPGVVKSARPSGRPEGFAARVSDQRTASLAAVSSVNSVSASTDNVAEIDPSSLPVGTNLTQLGAYPSPEIARQQWTDKAAKFEDYMAGKARVIQRAESGGRAFYRLRVHGFENLSEARQFCAALQAEGAECISVVVRK